MFSQISGLAGSFPVSFFFYFLSHVVLHSPFVRFVYDLFSLSGLAGRSSFCLWFWDLVNVLIISAKCLQSNDRFKRLMTRELGF